jgi:hypothetical protein
LIEAPGLAAPPDLSVEKKEPCWNPPDLSVGLPRVWASERQSVLLNL